MKTRSKHLFSATLTAILTAVAIILGRFFSINVWNLSIGFSFVPIMLCGILAGPIFGGICGALADFLGAILFPFGPFFPGFTLTAFIGGVLCGVIGITERKIKGNIRFCLAASVIILLKETLCSVLLNSLWISILYSSPFKEILISRIPLASVVAVLEIILALVAKTSIIPALNKERKHK